MAVVSLVSFRTEPGKLVEHMAINAQAIQHLHGMGMQTMLLQASSGADVGAFAFVTNFENNAAYAAATAELGANAQWQEFYANASSAAVAMQEEGSLMQDVDPNWQPDPDRPTGVLMATQWRAKDGRLVDFMGRVMDSLPHIDRLGGSPRVLQSIIGRYPMTVTVSVGFADLAAYGAYADAIAADAGWQAFWADALSDPTGDMIRSGLYLNVTGG